MCFGLVAGLESSTEAQRPIEPPRTTASASSIVERSGAPALADERGATYRDLERSAVRVTTRFADRTTAMSERDWRGTIRTRLVDIGGNQLQSSETLDRTTLDAANRRHHPAGEIESLESEWPDGFVATTVNTTGSRSERLVFTTLRRNGLEVGRLGWYPDEQILRWSFPGLTKGYVSPQRLSTIGGKWPFVPDMAWANVQGIAFHKFHTRVKQARRAQRDGWLARVSNWIVPALHGDEPGCDGLHYLDNTILRPCCDQHDKCYAKNGCSYTSWWMVWTSWRCDYCNAQVIMCFLTTADPCPVNPLFC